MKKRNNKRMLWFWEPKLNSNRTHPLSRWQFNLHGILASNFMENNCWCKLSSSSCQPSYSTIASSISQQPRLWLPRLPPLITIPLFSLRWFRWVTQSCVSSPSWWSPTQKDVSHQSWAAINPPPQSWLQASCSLWGCLLCKRERKYLIW